MLSSSKTILAIVPQATPYLPALNAGPATNKSGLLSFIISINSAFAFSKLSPKYESPHITVATIS